KNDRPLGRNIKTNEKKGADCPHLMTLVLILQFICYLVEDCLLSRFFVTGLFAGRPSPVLPVLPPGYSDGIMSRAVFCRHIVDGIPGYEVYFRVYPAYAFQELFAVKGYRSLYEHP